MSTVISYYKAHYVPAETSHHNRFRQTYDKQERSDIISH